MIDIIANESRVKKIEVKYLIDLISYKLKRFRFL